MIDALRKLIAIPSITDATAEEGKPFGKNVNDALVYMLNFCQDLVPHEKLRQLPGFC